MDIEEAVSVFVADDESLARERIKRLLAKHARYTLCGEAENGEQAITKITELKPDVVLLDIRMPGMDGLEAAAHITALDQPPAVIFCTAYDEYAIQAFRHNAVGYLLKPASEEDLIESLEKANRLNQLQLKQIQSINGDEARFVANTWQGQEIIPLDQIYLFKADHKYVSAVHKNGECISDQTLKELEERYSKRFIRVHRNSLVNKKEIQSVHKDASGKLVIHLKHSPIEVPVSRRHAADLKAFLETL